MTFTNTPNTAKTSASKPHHGVFNSQSIQITTPRLRLAISNPGQQRTTMQFQRQKTAQLSPAQVQPNTLPNTFPVDLTPSREGGKIICRTDAEYEAAIAHSTQMKKVNGRWQVTKSGDYWITNYEVGYSDGGKRRSKSGWTLYLARPLPVTLEKH